MLFACCLGTLIVKKARAPEGQRAVGFADLAVPEVVEGGERTWFQFSLDSSKQLIGAGQNGVDEVHVATEVAFSVFSYFLKGCLSSKTIDCRPQMCLDSTSLCGKSFGLDHL